MTFYVYKRDVSKHKNVFKSSNTKSKLKLLLFQAPPPYIYKQITTLGGIRLIEITFQNKMDAEKLMECFHLTSPSSHRNVRLLAKEDHHIIRFSVKKLEIVKDVFRHFILSVKRNDWLQAIIKNMFHFTDPEEQQQIIQIVHSIINGNRNELFPLLREVEEEENVTATIGDILSNNKIFSFDSFVQFRLRSLMANLEKYVEVAIDEYKMEQEYQMFIQMLREFLQGRVALMEELHLLFTESVVFFDAHLKEIKREKLTELIDRKLLSNHPVYIDSATIAPLLSVAPPVIYIYTKEAEHPLVRTIKNIFEERVAVCSPAVFYKKKEKLKKLSRKV